MEVMMSRLDERREFRARSDYHHGGEFPVILMNPMARLVDLNPEIVAFLRKSVDIHELLTLVARLLSEGSTRDG
jgi:hypothetical protein